jgi:hypothetical protein
MNRMSLFGISMFGTICMSFRSRKYSSLLQFRSNLFVPTSSSSFSTNSEFSSVQRISSLVDEVRDGKIVDVSSSLWEIIKLEAFYIAENDNRASTLLSNAVISQPSLSEAIMDYVANQLDSFASGYSDQRLVYQRSIKRY